MTERRPWTRGRVLAAVAIVAMVSMWVYVLYLAFGPGRQPPPDRLADPAFGVKAQAVCKAAHDEVSELPVAVETETAAERAVVIAEANERFATMIDDLEPLAPDGEDGDIVAEWIADWRTYLDDRASFADRLQDDPDAQLFVSTRLNDHVTDYIDAFAADNRMPACGTPTDL